MTDSPRPGPRVRVTPKAQAPAQPVTPRPPLAATGTPAPATAAPPAFPHGPQRVARAAATPRATPAAPATLAPATESRTVIITGAGSGIGRATARAFLAAGYRVTVAGRRVETLAETVRDGSGKPHPRALVMPTDVTDPTQVELLFSAHLSRFGRLDVLVNNAGSFGPAATVGELDPTEWAKTLAVNVTGYVLCAGAAFRHMSAQQPRGGRIINNGSISAHSPRPRSVAYTTTKHAITGLTRSIELDGREHRITCAQIDIGNTATELLDTIGASSGGALQADGSRRPEPTFDVAQAARTIVYMAGLPLEVSIGQVTMTAAGMPFIGRG